MVAKVSKDDSPKQSGSLTTAIHLPRRTWELLREVAFSRARRQGGRASVSKVLVDLVELSRADFEKEI
jgi:hypothetical protein